MDIKKIILVINELAGSKISKVFIPFLESRLNLNKYELKKVYYKSEKTLPEKINFHCSDENTLFVVFGGDGTLNLVLNGIMNSNFIDNSYILPLPFGSTNLFCKKLGIKSYKNAFELINKKNYVEVDVLKVEYGDDFSKRNYFFSWMSTGFDEIVVKDMYGFVKLVMGKLGYLLHGLINFLKHSFNDIKIKYNGNDLIGTYLIVGQVKYYGSRLFRPLFKSSLFDNKIDLFLIKSRKKSQIIYSLILIIFRSLFSLKFNSKYVEYVKSDEFLISSSNNKLFQIDGDLCGKLPAKVSMDDKKVKVLSPKK